MERLSGLRHRVVTPRPGRPAETAGHAGVAAGAPNEGGAPPHEAPGCTQALRDGAAMICSGLGDLCRASAQRAWTFMGEQPELAAAAVMGSVIAVSSTVDAVSTHDRFHSLHGNPNRPFGPTGDPASVTSYVVDGANVVVDTLTGAGAGAMLGRAGRIFVELTDRVAQAAGDARDAVRV